MDEPIDPMIIGGGVSLILVLMISSVIGIRAYRRRKEAEFEAMMNEEVDAPAEAEEEVPEEDPIDYGTLTVPELKELLQERGLVVSGVKAELVSRLVEDDENLAKYKARLGHDQSPPKQDEIEEDDELEGLAEIDLDMDEDEELEGLEAVSYTHLTLPTKRIV